MVFSLGVALIVVTAMVVAIPLLRGTRLEVLPTQVDDAVLRLQQQKRDAYGAIREAELDFRMGKLTQADYEAIRTAQEAQALAAMQALEHETPAGGGGTDPGRPCAACGAELHTGSFCAACGAAV